MGDGLEKRNGPREGAVEPSVKPTAGYGLDASGSVTPRQLAVKRVAVFVDGFNLYHGMHEAFGRKYLWLDLQALSLSLLKPDQKLVAVHYFTARVRNDPQGAARQALYLGALKATGVRVVEGRFQEGDLVRAATFVDQPLMNPRSDLGFRRCRAHSGLLR
jgi:hypothetical protein